MTTTRPDWTLRLPKEFFLAVPSVKPFGVGSFFALTEVELLLTHAEITSWDDPLSGDRVMSGWYGEDRERASAALVPAMRAFRQWRDGDPIRHPVSLEVDPSA